MHVITYTHLTPTRRVSGVFGCLHTGVRSFPKSSRCLVCEVLAREGRVGRAEGKTGRLGMLGSGGCTTKARSSLNLEG